MSKYRIVVDSNLCIGAQPCVVVAPGVFQMNDENKAYVIDENGADDETILEAARSCPVLAISLFNKETGEQVYP